jgi:hypothetical protein
LSSADTGSTSRRRAIVARRHRRRFIRAANDTACGGAAIDFATRRSACDQAFHRTRLRGAASATNCAAQRATGGSAGRAANRCRATGPAAFENSHDADDEPATTPLGDWQTEGNKGSVRIERCGAALCGYVLSPPSGSKGETVLNMKPKAADLWTGNIYSRDSGLLLRDDDGEGDQFAPGRSLRARHIFLLRHYLEPHRRRRGEADYITADIVHAAVVAAQTIELRKISRPRQPAA